MSSIRRVTLAAMLLSEILPLWLSLPSHASNATADTMTIGSISGQASLNGIAVSSSILIVGSSLTLQGSAGYIVTQSSINGSSFWGDGSGLAEANTLIATQTFSGANTFLSSFTVQSAGNSIILSTSSLFNNVQISTSGISFYPNLHGSSSTIVPEASTTNTALGPCVSGSTLTITTTGGAVEVAFSGVGTMNVFGSSPVVVGFLQDGGFTNDMNQAKGVIWSISGTIFQGPISFWYIVNPPAGVHSYCLTLAAPRGGTAKIVNNNTVAQIFRARNLFYVKELK